MTYIFIRHDKKKYTNGRGPEGSPRFDPPIDYDEESPHNEAFKNITPTRIFTSPFLRCRQTAERAYPDIPIEILPMFSDYLGNWKDIFEEDFTPFTWRALNKFTFEKSYGHFQKRMSKAYTSKILPIPKENEVFLVVMHGTCLKTWCKMISSTMKSSIKSSDQTINDTKIIFLKESHNPVDGFKIDTIFKK